MTVCCFGSLNIDRVYAMDHIVRPGETQSSTHYAVHAGGKGLNQSVALSRTGLDTCHAGKIGPEGLFLRDILDKAGVDTSRVIVDNTVSTGHAIIQVETSGQNSILLFGGANQCITADDRRTVWESLPTDSLVVFQNELNDTDTLIREAHKHGFRVAFNAAPMNEAAKACPYELVDFLFVNETEAQALTGETDPDRQLEKLMVICPGVVVLTLGCDGARVACDGRVHAHGIYPVQAVDTTAAGDTYTGFFLASYLEHADIPRAMELAARASALTVTRPGAAESIPTLDEVLNTALSNN